MGDIMVWVLVTILDIGMAKEVPKNLEMLELHHNITADQNMICRDNEEVRVNQVPHLDRMPLLKPTLMPQPGITHITQAIMDITDTASAILDIMGMDMDIPIMDITGDEDKNLEFFSTSKHNKFKHNMDLMELVQKNSKIVLDAIRRIWINKIGKKDLFQ